MCGEGSQLTKFILSVLAHNFNSKVYVRAIKKISRIKSSLTDPQMFGTLNRYGMPPESYEHYFIIWTMISPSTKRKNP